jgi:hypothetical protein
VPLGVFGAATGACVGVTTCGVFSGVGSVLGATSFFTAGLQMEELERKKQIEINDKIEITFIKKKDDNKK